MTAMPQILRPGSTVMEVERMGAAWPTKFSFSQSFLRLVSRIGFSCRLHESALDARGRGHVVYRIDVADQRLSFVVFSDPLSESEQQDRIIATRWDAWAGLFIGEPSPSDITQSRAEIQNVVWGRAAPGTITWSRANRSARLFDHVVGSLAAGRQPSMFQLNQVGYLIRTTGFSGNGRNGMHDFTYLRDIDHPLQAPYHVQMLAAYMWREFGYDLATHLARAADPEAVDLAPEIRRFLGVGNSSGIGLVPFVVRHPRLVHRWIEARETALAEVRADPFSGADPRSDRLVDLIADAIAYLRQEPEAELDEFPSARAVASDLERLEARFGALRRDAGPYANPAAALLAEAAREGSADTEELLGALVLELHEDGRVDPNALCADEGLSFSPTSTAGDLLTLILDNFPWVARFAVDGERPFFWYASEENMEPRRGSRGVDEGEAFELPVDILGRLELLIRRLRAVPADETLAQFVLRWPDMDFMLRWASTIAHLDYSVARTDLLSAEFSPLKLMRFQLATYGMLKFRPRSKTWLRATILQGAGLPGELATGDPGDGLLPRIPAGYDDGHGETLGE